MKLTEKSIIKELFDITSISHGLSDLEAKLHTRDVIQQILSNQEIVEKLHNFIKHCDEMIHSYDSQLLVSTDSKHGEFLISQMEEWIRKKEDLTELIKFKLGDKHD